MKKRISATIIIIYTLLTFPSIVYAENMKPIYNGINSEKVYSGYLGCDFNEVLSDTYFYDENGLVVIGDYRIEKWDSSKAGIYEFAWTYTPFDSLFETKKGIIKIKFNKAAKSKVSSKGNAIDNLYEQTIYKMKMRKRLIKT